MIQIIPLQAVPSQEISVVVGQQQCQFLIQQKLGSLYFDLIVNGQTVCNTRIIRNAVPMLREVYFGVTGDFQIVDTQGSDDPQFGGLGGRWQFVYTDGVA